MTEYKCVRQSDEFKVSEDDVDLKTKLSSYVDGASPPVITEDNPVPSTWEEGDVRPLDHQNDCFYATLAGLQEKSIPEIELQTGISAKPTANLDEIKELYDKAGYYGEFKHFSDRTEVKNYIRDSLLARPNMGLKLAIGYILSGAECGHVKVIKAWISNKGELKYRLIDFQKDTEHGSRFNKPSLPHTNYFWLWETGKRYPISKRN